MSDLTPPKYWKTQGQADYWLDKFIGEADRPLRYQELFRVSSLVFDTIRDGWNTRIVLKKRFADDPEALVEFVKCERLPWSMRERYMELNGYREEDWE